MARLVDTTLDAIRTVNPETIENALWLAQAFLEKHTGGRLGEPLCPEVLAEEVTDEDILELRDALIGLVAIRPFDECASHAAFVLGKWEDRAAIPTLIEFMKLNFVNLTPKSPRTRAVWNAMTSLDLLGEDVIPWEDGRKYYSGNEFERNYQVAVNYLKKKGHPCQ